MLTATHIETALKAAGAGWDLVMPAADIAKAFNDAILTYGDGLFKTTNSVAALLSESMMESAYFRTTEEYNKTEGLYQPFRGRTFIQITWESNYRKFGTWCLSKGLVSDAEIFVKNPLLLADLKWAAIGPVWYFTQVMFHGKPLVAYSDNIDQVGKAVNMGDPFSKNVPNGHKARLAAFAAVSALGPTIVPVKPTPPKEPVVAYSSKYKTNYIVWRGGKFPLQTVEKLKAIPTTVRITQGGDSYAPASSMTHAGYGVGDINTDGLTKDEVWQLCRELWEVNIIPCPRGFSSDSFQGRTIRNTNDGNEHIHFLDMDEYDHMHPEAQAQVREIKAGGDGLVGNRSFVGPGIKWRTDWSKSMYNPVNIKPGGKYKVVSGTLQGLNSEREPRPTARRKKGYVVTAVKVVKRWGRWNAVTAQDTFYAIKDNEQTYLQRVEESKS